MIRFDKVSFTYQESLQNGGLRDVDLTINKGECVLLCGRSGCGKTTLTRLVNGLIPYFYPGEVTGTTYVDGKNIQDYPIYEVSEYVGSVFQNPRSQFFNVDTDSEISFGMENLTYPREKMKERISKTVADLDIAHLTGRSIFELSGGEKQKVAFAMMNLANASLDNIAEINNLPTENEKQGTTQFADTQADVRFENVSFSYDGKRDAVSHVSFSAKPGTITALVGPSGSGKSTLLNLIPGFVTPKNGRILLNWKDAATLKHSDLVRHVSVVFQEVYLFQDTMMNNIRMGNQSATDEQVVEAAKKAHCHEFIEKLPQGYQTVISEGGASLSGGERQRVAIARAILKDSPIILLDEALSSLDAENAVAIQKGIEEMIKGKTVFLVSHTLSYIQNSDQILVLSDGILQGCGKHEELLQTVPLYQTMWEKEKSIKNWKLA